MYERPYNKGTFLCHPQVMALQRARCEYCGDGDATASEQCDDGAGNADAPNARCRSSFPLLHI